MINRIETGRGGPDGLVWFYHENKGVEYCCTIEQWEVYEAKKAILAGDCSEKAVDRLIEAVRENIFTS